jgi:hypothetical protein
MSYVFFRTREFNDVFFILIYCTTKKLCEDKCNYKKEVAFMFESNQFQNYSGVQDYNQNTSSHSADFPHIDATNQRVFERNVKIHGKRSALTIVATKTRLDGYQTLTVEGAMRKEGAANVYDWTNKISVQLTKHELPHFIAVLVGMKGHAEFKNHGEKNNKSLAIERQDKNLFVSLCEAGKKAAAVPVSFDDSLLLSLYCLNVYMRNYENLSDEVVLKLIARMVNEKGV